MNRTLSPRIYLRGLYLLQALMETIGVQARPYSWKPWEYKHNPRPPDRGFHFSSKDKDPGNPAKGTVLSIDAF